MRRPEFYPGRPAQVDLKQTHMSWVFLAGREVYKVKKPVHYAFADAATLKSRYFLCSEEVRLNRRLAPELLNAAREFRSDLIVIPTHGRGGLKRLVLGSAAERVIRESSIPVLTLRHLDEGSGNLLSAPDLPVYRCQTYHGAARYTRRTNPPSIAPSQATMIVTSRTRFSIPAPLRSI
jgi:hypothetical protein